MLSIAVIVFREVLEISLILGVVLVATRGLPLRGRWITVGLLAGVLGSCAVAFSTSSISDALSGMGQEVFNAAVLVVAAVLITWTVVWMKQHSRELVNRIKSVSAEVVEGKRPLGVIAMIVALSVLREGSEIVLMSYGVMIQGGTVLQLIAGATLGLIAGSLVGGAIYYGMIKMATRHVFSVTSVLLAFLAAGMVSQAVEILGTVGLIPVLATPLWDSSWLLSERSIFGMALQTLVGYSAQPTAVQLVSYILTLGVIGLLVKRFSNPAAATTSKGGRALVIVLASAAFMGMTPVNAQATYKVYSPIVEYREFEIEARGRYEQDKDPTVDGGQVHKYAVGYGIFPRFFFEVYGEFEKLPDDAFEMESVELEGRYQVFEQGERWLDLGLYLAYEFPVESGGVDKLETKLLLQKELSRTQHMVNLIAETEFGEPGSEAVELEFAWSSRYRWRRYFEPGVELWSDMTEMFEGASFENQKHLLGPVIYGRLGRFKYDIGVLSGLTDSVANTTFKWIVEYEFFF